MRSANAPTKYALDDIRYDAGNDNNSNHNHNNRMINEFRYTQARSLSSTVGTADILRHTAAPVLFLDLHTPLLTYMLGPEVLPEILTVTLSVTPPEGCTGQLANPRASQQQLWPCGCRSPSPRRRSSGYFLPPLPPPPNLLKRWPARKCSLSRAEVEGEYLSAVQMPIWMPTSRGNPKYQKCHEAHW